MSGLTRYQGDPKLTLDADGADLVFKGGQPEMDRGLENYVLMLLFTKKGWSGNTLFQDPDQRVESDFEKEANEPITAAMLVNVGQAAERALNRMISTKMASKIIAQARNPEGQRLEVGILIQPPGQDIQVLLLEKNGQNWINQAVDPAYLRTT